MEEKIAYLKLLFSEEMKHLSVCFLMVFLDSDLVPQ